VTVRANGQLPNVDGRDHRAGTATANYEDFETNRRADARCGWEDCIGKTRGWKKVLFLGACPFLAAILMTYMDPASAQELSARI
jgi:hypothetical protein